MVWLVLYGLYARGVPLNLMCFKLLIIIDLNCFISLLEILKWRILPFLLAVLAISMVYY